MANFVRFVGIDKYELEKEMNRRRTFRQKDLSPKLKSDQISIRWPNYFVRLVAQELWGLSREALAKILIDKEESRERRYAVVRLLELTLLEEKWSTDGKLESAKFTILHQGASHTFEI